MDLTATVAPSDASGTVQFKDGGNDIGSPVPVSGGSATLSHTFDSVGAHDITAAYNAGPGFHSSTSGVQTVDVSADTTTTISAPNAALVGDSITVSAVVTPANAVGTVQFKDGETNLGAPVAVVNGTASLTRSYDASGTHSFTAVFTGEAGYGDSVSTATQLDVSDPDWGTTTTVVEPLTAVVGEPTNLSATVSPIPSSGTVTFKVDGAEVGTAPVGTGDGVAILPHTFASAGTAAVTAEFSGGTGFIGSTSTSFTVNVTDPEPARADTTTSLTVSGSAQVGKALQLKATVAPGTANGMIQFKSGTTPIGAPVAVVNASRHSRTPSTTRERSASLPTSSATPVGRTPSPARPSCRSHRTDRRRRHRKRGHRFAQRPHPALRKLVPHISFGHHSRTQLRRIHVRVLQTSHRGADRRHGTRQWRHPRGNPRISGPRDNNLRHELPGNPVRCRRSDHAVTVRLGHRRRTGIHRRR